MAEYDQPDRAVCVKCGKAIFHQTWMTEWIASGSGGPNRRNCPQGGKHEPPRDEGGSALVREPSPPTRGPSTAVKEPAAVSS